MVKFPDDGPKKEPETEKKEEIKQQEAVEAQVEVQPTQVHEPIPMAQEEDIIELEEYSPQDLEEEFIQAEKIISHKPNITIIPQDTRLKSLFV